MGYENRKGILLAGNSEKHAAAKRLYETSAEPGPTLRLNKKDNRAPET